MAGSKATLGKIRAICLGLPEVEERSFGGHTAPAFRVKDKLFVMTSEDGSSVTLKGDRGVQQILVASNPDRYFVPKYVGPKGWVGVALTEPAGIDWGELEELIMESYCLIAPKKLAAQLTAEATDPS